MFRSPTAAIHAATLAAAAVPAPIGFASPPASKSGRTKARKCKGHGFKQQARKAAKQQARKAAKQQARKAAKRYGKART